MTDKKEMPLEEREVMSFLVKGFSKENILEWFLERVRFDAQRWDFLVIMDALVIALKKGKMADIAVDQVKSLGEFIGEQLIEEGFVPIDKIRHEWREHFGLFK